MKLLFTSSNEHKTAEIRRQLPGFEILNLKDLQNILGYDCEEMLELLKESVMDKVYKTQEIEELLEEKIIKLISHIPYSELVVESNSEFSPYRYNSSN